MTSYRLTRRAAADITAILRDTAQRFGSTQRDTYATLMQTAALRLATDPTHPAARPRPDLAPDIRSYHLELAAARLGAASHILYFIPTSYGPTSHDTASITILRVLHERMDPTLHFPQPSP